MLTLDLNLIKLFSNPSDKFKWKFNSQFVLHSNEKLSKLSEQISDLHRNRYRSCSKRNKEVIPRQLRIVQDSRMIPTFVYLSMISIQGNTIKTMIYRHYMASTASRYVRTERSRPDYNY